MKTIKVLYNNSNSAILDIVDKFRGRAYIESYNSNNYNDRSKVRQIQEDYGTKNSPLIIFEDENLNSIGAIWSENKPDWEKEIDNKLKILI